MSIQLNETHDIALRSWIASANTRDHAFPIQNLPYGVFRRKHRGEVFRVGVAIGDYILDLRAAFARGAFDGFDSVVHEAIIAATTGSTLNPLMELDTVSWSALRLALSSLLRQGSAQQTPLASCSCLIAQADAEHTLPAHIGDYSDFYTSIHHATAVGKLLRPDHPLPANYKWLPIGYHGRSSSIAVSGQQVRRPLGQTKTPTSDAPVFGPCQRLDYEMEVGIFIGPGNVLGDAITINQAESHVFGLCLLNDWSARDIQTWEYQPLGPFLAKNFASTITPWIVTLEALAPYRTAWTRAAADPQPLAYLDSVGLRDHGAFDVQLEVLLQTKAMRAMGMPPQRLSLANFRDAYWSVAQLVAHHTVSGCNLRAGDLLGSGTQSGSTPESAGSLLELTAGGKRAINLNNGETRIFIEDGDTVIMHGWAEREGLPRIGFGDMAGTVLPARSA